jgi:hypothetical protein
MFDHNGPEASAWCRNASGKEREKMRKLVLVSMLFLTGCQNVVGPLGYRKPMRVDDPGVTIDEQQRRARDRLALPEEAGNVAPRLDFMPPNTGAP